MILTKCPQCKQVITEPDSSARSVSCPNCKQTWSACRKCEKFAMSASGICQRCGHNEAKPLSLNDIQEGAFIAKVFDEDYIVIRCILEIQPVSSDRGRAKYQCLYREYVFPGGENGGLGNGTAKCMVRWAHRLATADEIKASGFSHYAVG